MSVVRVCYRTVQRGSVLSVRSKLQGVPRGPQLRVTPVTGPGDGSQQLLQNQLLLFKYDLFSLVLLYVPNLPIT